MLSAPDGQVLPDENDAYEAFMDERPTVRVGRVDGTSSAWVLRTDDQWEQYEVRVTRDRRALTLIANSCMLRARAPRIAKCEQNIWRRTCGPAPFGLRVVANPDRRVARSIRWDSPFAVSTLPSSLHCTSSLFSDRCRLSATAKRPVSGTVRIRLPVVVAT